MITGQILVNGIIAGSMYALVAVGFSLIYSTNRFVHFGHGAVVAIGGYLAYQFFVLSGLPFWFSAILSVLFTGIIGLIIFGVIYRPLIKKKASSVILLIASLGIMILLENLLAINFGSTVVTINLIETTKGINFWGVIITPLQLIIIFVALVLFITLHLFLKYTIFGKVMRAVSDNPELAQISGINTKKVQYVSFFVASVVASIAGILIGLEQNLQPNMGTPLIVKGFTGAVIGGVTSIPGAVLGSYFLGIVENIGVWFFSAGMKDAIAFVLLLIFLLFRPQGILGILKGARK